MAKTAFDKHVEFCEIYMSEVYSTVATLYKEGPTEKALLHASKLSGIKDQFAVWLTEEMNNNLFPFEQALRDIGAGESYINSTSGVDRCDEKRSEFIKKTYDDFRSVLSVFSEKNELNSEIAASTVKSKMRGMLGIDDLVFLRQALMSKAKTSVLAIK